MILKFKRKIIAIILIICMLFTISAISAADGTTDAVSTTNATVEAVSEDVANDNNLAMENDVESLGETDDGSFTALNTRISGATSIVTLENDYEYATTDSGTAGIAISSAITVDGQGHIIDAKGSSRIFSVSVSNVILKNIIFKNAFYSGNGGAIYDSTNDITIENCTFINNEATNGGAIYSNAYSRLGSITDSTFINNRANTQGAAIYNYADAGTVEGCIFVNNSASTSLIYTYSAITVKNSILVNNEVGSIFSAYSPSITANNNWWGTTADNYQNLPANLGSGVTANKYYILDMALDDQGTATVTLNNLYENGVVTVDNDYALPSIKFDVATKGTTADDNAVLAANGAGTFGFVPADAYEITISYNGVELTRDVKPTFASLNNKINDVANEITLEQDYIYDSTKDSGLTNGIEFAKDMTIDGQGHIIDAKHLTNIFYFNDDTGSYSLTLKNIIFANATGTNGAAVYFKGNKIEIINCTFINNAATSQGDAVYVVDAASSENKITESRFINSTGSNSVVCLNLDSTNSRLNMNNSIFVKNGATYNVKGTSNVIVEYNWLGNTIENYNDENVAKVDGVTLNNWLFLKIDANAALKGIATISLNNVYDGSQIATFEEYSLPAITLNIGGIDTTTQVSSISLGADGKATYQFKMDKPNGALTASYDDISTTKELEYVCVDDGSFKALNEIIWFSSENDVIDLTKDYVYSETDTITPGIQITKTITIDGHGKTIDAKGNCGIFLINSPNVVFKNMIFKNGIFETGGAIYASQNANYLTIDNCTFINNTATNTDGGAIYSASYYFGSVVDSTFINNTAIEDGAAIFTYSYYTTAVVDRCVFINNSAPYSIIYAYYNFNPHDSIFLNNSANKVFTGRYSGYSDFNIGTNWYGNTYDNYNSAIATVSVKNWLYLDIKFLDNVAIVSLNNLYTQSSSSSSVYSSYNLPEITLNINSTSLDLGGIDKITLDSTGKAIIPYTKISEDAKLTVSNEYVSFTKDYKVGDFDCLQYLIDTSTGNTIELTRNYTYTEGVDTITEGITFTKSLTIDGKGHTIDAKELSRIFYTRDESRAVNVVYKNINFVNAKATHGGAVYFLGNTVEFINCTFNNNTATANPGGAVYLDGYGSKFIDCSFTGNSITISTKNGGAVYIYERGGVNNFTNCVFMDNTATQYGGAIATAQGKSILTIDKSIFINNKANYGFSIYCYGGPSAEFYLNNSLIFSTSLTGDTNNKVYVQNTLRAGDVNNNWWMHINDANYNNPGYIRYSGGGLTVTKWLYLDVTCENEVATVSLNNLYDNSAGTSSVYGGELPQITFDLSAVNAIVNSTVTLDKNGQGEVEYSLTDQTGSLTATYDVVSLTKDLTFEDSFTTLQSKIDRASEGSELILTHDYIYDSTKDVILIDGIVIDKDLTIDGQGFTIDANNAARIFNIDDNTKNIVLKNIKFINAVGDNGAAINANCNNMEIINCTFENNQATAYGNAIYLVANGCDITESTFINNIGTGSTIYIDSESDDATFNIANSILVNNGGTNVVKAKGDLTAEYNWWGNTADATSDLSYGLAQKWYVLDMTVDDAQSIASISLNNLNDGTSYENYALPTITLNIQATNANTRKDEVTLDENGDASVGYIVTDGSGMGTLAASYNGVSITKEINYNAGSDYSFKALKKLIDQANENDVITLTHDYEYVVGYDDIATGSVAAITEGIDITQNNLTINGNGFTIDAKEQTRVFNIGVADRLIASNVTIKNTTFVNGKISGQGGAVRWYGWNGTLINCTFENNSATNNGGSIYWCGQYGNITNCTFEKNSAGSNNGGALYIQGKNTFVFNATFIDNKASKGAAVHVASENVTINESRFIKNTGSSMGGAIYVTKNNVSIINSTFAENIANSGGAIYLDTADDVTIIDSEFVNNSADKGGAIYWNNGKNRNITNSRFVNNAAVSHGGAIYWTDQNGGKGTIYNSTFTCNSLINTGGTSSSYGGAIYLYTGNLIINKTDFINNTINGKYRSYGGAVYDGSSGQLNITDSNFIGNGISNSGTSTNSHAYGGAIYIDSGTANITKSSFNLNFVNSQSANTYGTAVHWEGGKGAISNSSFLNNHGKSSFSGAIVARSSSKVNITNSIFLNNTYGSNNLRHAYASSATLNFTDCWFGNTKDNSGEDLGTPPLTGIIYNNKLTLNTVHDQFMAVGEDKEIKFVLEYVKDGKQIIYDSSKLPKVNLTLSSVNGDLDKNSSSMDETILFNANHFGSASITAKYNGIEFTENLYAKDKPTITVDPIVVHVGESIGVNVIELIPSDASLSFLGVDGDEFILVAGNGYVDGLKEGSSTLYIKYNGNDNYSPITVEVPVTVIKYTTAISTNLTETTPVDSLDVDWGADAQNIIIGFNPGNPNPSPSDEFKMKYKSNDTNVATVSIVDGKAYINFRSVGTAKVTFYFEENDKYYGSEKDITVTVKKVPSSAEFSGDVEFDYLSSGTTTLTLVGCTVDDVNIAVDGHPEAVIGYENNIITVSELDVGTYNLKVTTTPDENHTSVDATAGITVNRIDSSVEFSNDVEFDYLSSGTTTLTLVGCTVSEDDISVVDHSEAVISLENNVVTVSNLTAGTYTLKVTTTPDGNHKSVDETAVITVNKIDSSVEFSNDVEFDYLSSGTTTLRNYDGCSVDDVNITVENHPEAVISFENNVITVSGLGAGTYTLKVTTTPDGNHKSVDVTANIKVNKIASSITLSNTDIVYKYDESNTTTVTLVGCSVDLVNITVDGNNVDGVTYDAQTKVITLSGIDVGTYNLKVTTTPDENHISVDATAAITVEKSNSSVAFSNPVSLFFSEEGTTTLTLNGCSVDLENITVVGHPEAIISYGNNVITVSNLNIGEYVLKVITTPDSNHLSVENTTSVSVYKESPKLDMEYSNITVGEKELVYVSMNTTGQVNITIYKDGTIIKTENVTIGSSKFNKTAFTGLKVGTYTISAYYEGQGRYNSSTLTYELVIRPIYDYEFSASVNDTVMGNKTNVTVNLPEGATGKIVIGDFESPVIGAKTVIELPEQNKLGKNNVTVKYVPDEDSKYSAHEMTVLYEISKVDTSISLSIVNKTTADPVTIAAAITAEGNVTFIVNGKKYSREIISNVATLELTDVAGGEYDVTAIYDGSEKYNNSTANDTYTVEKINSTISIEVNPTTIKTDEGATVTVEVQGSGIVTITVNGVETNVTVDSGVATLPIEKLAKGTTLISAKYLGDGKYNTNETEQITLTVNPINLEGFDIDIVDITVGDDAIAYVIIPSDATNMTNVTVKQADNVLFSENTTFKVIIPDLAVGTYNITAYYYGDDKYDVAEITKEFTVNPLNIGKLNFTATVNNTFVGDKTNVTVKISEDATGKIVIGDIEEVISKNEFVIELPAQTTAGLNNITVQYIPDENSKYGQENISAFYNVAKKSAEIKIEDIVGKKAGDDVEIVASAYEGALITVYVDGVKTTTVENISAGKHTIVATVEETDGYLAASANKTFEVTKSDVGTVAVIVSDSSVYVGEKLTINVNIVNVNNDVTGIVEINVNGTKYSLNLSESKVLEVVMDKVGEVTLSGRYLGDYKYDSKDAEFNHPTIQVLEKATPEITIEVDQLSVVGQEMTINVTNLENLTVTINGVEQSVNKGEISFTPTKDGAYTIIAKTTENKTHYAGESIASFTVINKTKQTPEITVSEIADAKVGSEITFTVDASVGEGVIVKVNDEIVPLKEGTYTYTPKTSGSHILYVETEENGQYSKGIKTQTFNVDKNDATIKVSADPVKVGETATIEVEVTPGATGLVIININGTEYSIKLPQTTLEIVLDKVGCYSISASYLGDNNYTENVSDVISLEVSQKAVSNFTVEIPDDIKVAEPFTINVTSESGADLEVYIDGVKQTLTDGKVNVDTLSAGAHTIEVVSPVTSTHMANSTTQTFTVSKKQAQIKIDVGSDLIVDKNIKLILESYPGAELVVYMDGKALDNWETPFKTTAGDHLIIATVADNDEYLGVTVNKTFTVAKKESSVHVSGSHATVGEKSIIEVDLTKDATGIVIVNVNGTEYSLNISENNSLSIVLDKAGLYNIIAKYLGDDKYLPSESEVNTIFAEDKKASVIDIDYPVVIYAGDDVNVTISSTGDALEVYIDGEKQTLKDGILAIENISSGTHVLEVVSLETAGFKYNSTSAVLNVAKKQAEITIADISGVKAGDKVSIVVTTDSDSSVVIYVDGERLESTTIEYIAAGSHTVIASVEESELYLKATANKTFTVDKLPATIEVNATNVTQGQATEITVTSDVDEGVVVVKLNGTEVAIDLAKGKSTSIVLDTPGIYEVRASYLGSDKYNGAAAASFIIEVFEKATPEVNVTIPEIKAGEDGNVNISIPNATGEVHVIIDGVDNIIPLNENGTADFTIPEMGAGNHSVVIVYPGDDTHEAKVVTQTVNVEKQTSEANITSPSDVKEGENATVKVEIANATGEVVIIIDGVEEKVPLVNGTIDYPLDNLSAGNHSVVVIYPGDDTHSSTYSSSSFNVEAEPVVVKLTTELTNITIADDLNITAYLVDENGKPISNAEIIYCIGEETKYINTADDGSFTIKGVAKSKVTIDYAGNETLLATNTSITLQNVITQPKLGSYFNVTEGTTFETYAVETAVGEKGALYAFTLRDSNGDPIVNATVTFAYKTVVFNSTTNENGTLYLGISTYLAQDALCALSYVGDDKHNATFVAFNFKIMKKPTVIKAYKAKFKVKTTVKKYTVTLKTYKLSSRDGKVYLKAGKVLKIKVNGRNFYATTNSKGQATFMITNLNKRGVYIAKVLYAGSDTYAGSIKKVKITVY